MILFFADVDQSLLLENEYKKLPKLNRLISYLSIKNKKKEKILEFFNNSKRVFVDSGGFSVRVRGVKIDVEEYGRFLKEYEKYIFAYANLDEKETEKTLYNFRILREKFGLKPIPVFHRDEYESNKYYLLKEYAEKYNYIALGGVAGTHVSKSYVIRYLDYCFSILKDYILNKNLKVHGFGMTASYILRRYPFYSIDSTSWLSKYGNTVNCNGLEIKNHCLNQFYKKFHYKYRNTINLKSFLRLEREITKLWELRGIKWD